jgi:RNA polymerase sigma-70 factor (ECF subfamily)
MTEQNLREIIETPEFLERLRRFDDGAYKILVEALRNRLYSLILRILKNPEEAEEILQETFLTVFDKIDGFQGKSKLATWIYAIATNAALSRLRKKNPETVTIDDQESLIIDRGVFKNREVVFPSEVSDPVVLKEIQEKLEAAIAALPDGYRELFILKEIEKFSIKEIADEFHLNPGVVKTRIHRARLQLRSILSDYWRS